MLEEIGRIVHQADLADDCCDVPSAVGLGVLIRSLTLTSGSDHDTLAIPADSSTVCMTTPAVS